VACILYQTDTEGNEKPIALSSQKLTEAQAKEWSTTWKEAFAVWALKTNRACVVWVTPSALRPQPPLVFDGISAQEFEIVGATFKSAILVFITNQENLISPLILYPDYRKRKLSFTDICLELLVLVIYDHT